MDQKEEIFKLRTSLKLCEKKIEAILNILSKEGVLTHEEVDEEIQYLIKEDSEDL